MKTLLSDKVYDIINKAQRWLVALGALYLAVAEIWNLPFGNEVNKTIVAIGTFLAIVLETATAKWQKDHAVAVLDLKEMTEDK